MEILSETIKPRLGVAIKIMLSLTLNRVVQLGNQLQHSALSYTKSFKKENS